jgi:hypothetical protein
VAVYYLTLAVFAIVGVAAALLQITWAFTPFVLIEFSVCAVVAAGAALFAYIGVTELANRN